MNPGRPLAPTRRAVISSGIVVRRHIALHSVSKAERGGKGGTRTNSRGEGRASLHSGYLMAVRPCLYIQPAARDSIDVPCVFVGRGKGPSPDTAVVMKCRLYKHGQGDSTRTGVSPLSLQRLHLQCRICSMYRRERKVLDGLLLFQSRFRPLLSAPHPLRSINKSRLARAPSERPSCQSCLC